MVVANNKALHDLEFDRLKEVVKQYASSGIGRQAVLSLEAFNDREAIEAEMAKVKEAISYLNRYSRFSFGAVEDIAPLLSRAEEHSLLEGEHLLAVLRTIEATSQIRASLTNADEIVALKKHASSLFDGSFISERINRAIDESGQVRDDASFQLRTLTQKYRTLEMRVERKLRATMERNPELISEPVLTRRNGRLVIAIKSGAVGQMPVIVHDRSATGQTLYAEPAALVAENNELTQIEREISEERLNILRELTKVLVEKKVHLLRDRSILAYLDCVFARASYAISNGCSFPRVSNRLFLREARHPLLNVDRVVPISLSMDERWRMIVITGPNTGGKTVTLKTIGLLTLMTQAGIPIPASPDSELRIVSKIRTDIGDEQSISQNLSTFSAHMKNIISIIDQADDKSLILLDELGAGTDPQEGAALGLSIIEALLESESYVAISTHLTPLKFFAIRHPEVKTASMEFDLKTLEPTFRVIEGVPGRSNAFLIARRLGLPPALVKRARCFMSKGEIQAEDIIEQLQRERQVMGDYRHKAEKALAAANELKRDYQEKIESFERQKESTLSSKVRQLDEFLRDSQAKVEKLLAKINANPDEEEMRAAYHKLSGLRKELKDKADLVDQRNVASQPSPEALHVGQTVHVRSVDADGIVTSILGHGKLSVDVSGIRLSTDVGDIEVRHRQQIDREGKHSFRVSKLPSSNVSLQLNVRGMTVAEALHEVEKYLDQLLLSDIKSASILHGKGTGALREAIREYLRSSSFVSSYGPGTQREGGEGITVFTIAGE